MTVLSPASLDGALLAAVKFVFVPVCLGRDGPFGGEVCWVDMSWSEVGCKVINGFDFEGFLGIFFSRG